MADPFDALRLPVPPAHPDPAFAARLRARLAAALRLPEGVAVTAPTAPTAPSGRAAPGAAGEPPAASSGAAVPYLAVADARRALLAYTEVLGGRTSGEPVVMPDGRIGHAEVEFPTGSLYLADEYPELGLAAPAPGAVSVSLVLTVADLDTTLAAAAGAGWQVTRETYEAYGHRNATVLDPFGHRWMLQEPLSR